MSYLIINSPIQHTYLPNTPCRFPQSSIEASIAQTNAKHLGKGTTVSNVFFTHGELDPSRPMGVQTEVNSESPVVVLEGYAHGKDLNSIRAADSAQLRAAKEQVTALVRKWLNM